MHFLALRLVFMKLFMLRPLLDLMLVILNFKIKISFFVQILLFFLSPYNFKNARNDSWHHKFDILSGFAVVLQFFDTPLRSEIAKLLPIIFKSVANTC